MGHFRPGFSVLEKVSRKSAVSWDCLNFGNIEKKGYRKNG